MVEAVTKHMVADKDTFQDFLFESITDKVDSVVLNTKENNQKVLLEIFQPLLPMACILLHLKACRKDSALGRSDILQYTLLPSLNGCDDYSFLEDCDYKAEAFQCLTTLAKFIKLHKLPITSNFAQFALIFEAYDCLI